MTPPRSPEADILHPRWFDLSAGQPTSFQYNGLVKSARAIKRKWPTYPEEWASLMDSFLPKELRSNDSLPVSALHQGEDDIRDLMELLAIAQSKYDINVLQYMTLGQRRYKAVLHLADSLLKPLDRSSKNANVESLPSNLNWPFSFTKGPKTPLELKSPSHPRKNQIPYWESSFDYDGATIHGLEERRVMQLILPLLAKLVVTATQFAKLDMKFDAERQKIMRTVHQIIARMHNLDLVPSEMYSYSLPQGTTFVQRPPILHLLSSRILSTVSDAVWRSQQDEAIEQALKQGLTHKQISQDVPGGRFRLKVRELGSEVWLEFLLWCCVEGGYAAAGTRIINILREETENPWYAVHWCSNHGIETRLPLVDWERAKYRLGGTAGRVEGYSADEPFAHIPSQTISAEVVLALVECQFNNMHTGIKGSGHSVQKFQKDILAVVSFLEPHALGPEYFNYLTVRFLQTGGGFLNTQPDLLRRWYEIITQLRSLETVQPQTVGMPGLTLQRIATQTELQASILHQALQGYMNQNNASQAVNCVTDIQTHVDSSRLESIGNFLLSSSQHGNPDDLPEGAHKIRLDFLKSHGQLPLYKLAAFLNLVTNTQLFGLGQWLLESEDVDGPLIPKSGYQSLCMTVALTKYAGATKDDGLMRQVLQARKSSKIRSSVNILRATVNASISLSDWRTARHFLRELKSVPGGGYSPKIVTRLGARIIQIESQLNPSNQGKDLTEATGLLYDILAGQYDGAKSGFMLPVRKRFDQEIGYLLRIFQNLLPPKWRETGGQAYVPAGHLADLARLFKPKYSVSNEANMSVTTFNDLLSAIVESRGAVEGVRMWNLFCKDPYTSATSEEVPSLEDYLVPEIRVVPGEEEGVSYVLRSTEQMPQLMYDRVPIIASVHEDLSNIPITEASLVDNKITRGSFNPIVVPNTQTLHVIVRAAIAEKKQLEDMLHTSQKAKLNKILDWATELYPALGYSKRDIELETQIPQSIRGEITSPTQLKWMNDRLRVKAGIREKGQPDIGVLFTSDAPLTRLPGVERLGTSQGHPSDS
ncbi:hypothetical protein LTR84_010401 [Exophiala bonariae]|uniref:Uncharacterized protein n=1 Tax=Exophiala bonariae TaxID=1690606 RepID=A0AAV9MTC6_9EURO|nr:hypothetical protein LTR84_010401 [Exophiala bonariae]